MKKKKIYQGRIMGLSVYDLTIHGRKIKRVILEHPGAAAMLAIDKDQKVLMVKQHRFPHGYQLEIPAGTLEKGERAKTCAIRDPGRSLDTTRRAFRMHTKSARRVLGGAC